MNTPISPDQQVLLNAIAEAEQALNELRERLETVDAELEEKSEQRQQYQLLETICHSLDELQEMGAADLFWGSLAKEGEREEQLEYIRKNVEDFRHQIDEIEKSKEPIEREIQEQNDRIQFLQEDLYELKEREEKARNEFVVERELVELPFRPMVMPWTRSGEDERRFRKVLGIVFLVIFLFNGLISIWELPEPDKNEVLEIPENLVKLVKKEKPIPKPPENRQEEKAREQEEQPSQNKPKPSATAKARKKAESTGVLAFKDAFSDLLADNTDAKLGSAARLSNKGAKASGDSNRNLVMAQASSNSGGISTSGLSRDVGGGGSKRLGGVSFSRVTSDIGTGSGADERPLSDGPGPSRTDEEIQIVFDRYKATLYRIYNRELRNNPVLKGKMMLRITIKPDGSVSACKLESSDMDAPALVKQIIARVKRFNFSPKKGVPTITILYPIDFLPAT